jgi:hypothetical protein
LNYLLNLNDNLISYITFEIAKQLLVMSETNRPVSLFNKIKKEAVGTPTVFVTLLNGKNLSVSLSLFTLTVNEAILEAI